VTARGAPRDEVDEGVAAYAAGDSSPRSFEPRRRWRCAFFDRAQKDRPLVGHAGRPSAGSSSTPHWPRREARPRPSGAVSPPRRSPWPSCVESDPRRSASEMAGSVSRRSRGWRWPRRAPSPRSAPATPPRFCARGLSPARTRRRAGPTAVHRRPTGAGSRRTARRGWPRRSDSPPRGRGRPEPPVRADVTRRSGAPGPCPRRRPGAARPVSLAGASAGRHEARHRTRLYQ
jgi:hypothetical protein